MKIAIVGSGAIGLFYGARLQRAGESVHFLMRSDLRVVRERGVSVRSASDSFSLEQVRACAGSDEIGLCDLVVIAVKTTSNDLLSEILRPLVGRSTRLLTLQNGLGNDVLLQRLFPANGVYAGLCFVCLNRIAPGVVENYMPGSVSIGALDSACSAGARELVALFGAAGVKTRFAENLQLMQWKKLVWNIPFNGLCVAAGAVATDTIVGEAALEAEARGLMSEVLDAAAAKGLSIEREFIDQQIEATRGMGAYRPSSLVDFIQGREIEVESIWGEPLRQGRALGCSMPRLALLYALIAQLCRSRPGFLSSEALAGDPAQEGTSFRECRK